MKVLVTGAAGGIGKAVVSLFLEKGHEVIGLDLKESCFSHPSYRHICADISNSSTLVEIKGIEILVCCAGVQNSADDIDVNLKGTVNVVEKYAFQEAIKSVLIVASASAHSGAEFVYYSVSKGGLLTYTRNVALRLAKYGATCNSVSPGGVVTDLNTPVLNDKELWKKIMDVTPLKKWAQPEELAQWCYFLTVINKSCTGEDILIDNGEAHLNATFIWTEKKFVSVSAAVIVRDNKVYAVQRKPGGEVGLKWEFPGGKIENGESAEQTVLREIKEELSTDICVKKKICEVEHEYRTFKLKMQLFLCTLTGTDPILKEHLDSRWLSKEDLLSLNWAEADYKVLPQIKETCLV